MKSAWVVIGYWEGDVERNCDYQGALLFKGWLIIQTVGYHPFWQDRQMKEHIHHLNLLLFFILKSIVINVLFVFREYIFTRKAKHPAKWNFVQRSMNFSSAAWGFLKVWKSKIMSMTTALKITLLIFCLEAQNCQASNIQHQRHWWWFPLSPNLSLKFHKVICDMIEIICDSLI